MAESKQPNNLVKRIVEILSKSDDGSYMFSELGKIYVPTYKADDHNIFVYDPTEIISFLDAYEQAMQSVGINRAIYSFMRENVPTRRNEWQRRIK